MFCCCLFLFSRLLTGWKISSGLSALTSGHALIPHVFCEHFHEWTMRCIRLHCKHSIISLLPRWDFVGDFFSQYWVKCAINIRCITEHFLRRAYSVLSSLWEIQNQSDWVIVTHHILNPNSQEAPEWNESTNRAILHADEYAFVPAYAFFSPTSPCDPTSSIIHYMHNVYYWLLSLGRLDS